MATWSVEYPIKRRAQVNTTLQGGEYSTG